MLLATNDISKLVSDLAPILAAAVTGIGTYLLTRNNNSDKLSQREYEYIIQERTRVQEMMTAEIVQIRKDKDSLRNDLTELRAKLAAVEEVEDECQLKLYKAQLCINDLQKKLKSS